MKKFLPIMLIASSLLTITTSTNAQQTTDQEPAFTITVLSGDSQNTQITLGDFLTDYFNSITAKHIPDSYQYINVLFPNVPAGSDPHTALQKGIYIGYIGNIDYAIPRDTPISQKVIATMVRRHFDLEVSYTNTAATQTYLSKIIELVPSYHKQYCSEYRVIETINLTDFQIVENEVFPVLDHVYEMFSTEYLYVDQINDNELIYQAIQGMVDYAKTTADDRFSNFYPPSTVEQSYDTQAGSYQGIGASVDQHDEGVLIISPFRGSPAEAAGLKPQDIVTALDGTSLVGMSLNDAVSLIRGPEGTTITLTILRDEQTFDVDVTRAKIRLDIMEVKELDDNTCLIQFNRFVSGIGQRFTEGVEQCQEGEVDTMIIDLRKNGGGALSAAYHIVEHFVPKGELAISLEGVGGFTENYYSHRDEQISQDISIRILIDDGSASASEVVASAIMDTHADTVLIGTDSFGKGVGQSVYYYSSDDSDFGTDLGGLEITSFARFTTEQHSTVPKDGFAPDHYVTDDPDTPVDEVLQFAQNLD